MGPAWRARTCSRSRRLTTCRLRRRQRPRVVRLLASRRTCARVLPNVARCAVESALHRRVTGGLCDGRPPQHRGPRRGAGIEEAPPPPPNTFDNNPRRHKVVCKHWLRGLCKKGDACDFLHRLSRPHARVLVLSRVRRVRQQGVHLPPRAGGREDERLPLVRARLLQARAALPAPAHAPETVRQVPRRLLPRRAQLHSRAPQVGGIAAGGLERSCRVCHLSEKDRRVVRAWRRQLPRCPVRRTTTVAASAAASSATTQNGALCAGSRADWGCVVNMLANCGRGRATHAPRPAGVRV